MEATKVTIKKSQTFTPFSKAIQHSWKSLPAKKQKKLSPMLWGMLGQCGLSMKPSTVLMQQFVVLWEYQSRHSGSLPTEDSAAQELQSIAKEILPKHGVDASLLSAELIESVLPLLSGSPQTEKYLRSQKFGKHRSNRVYANVRNHRRSHGTRRAEYARRERTARGESVCIRRAEW